MTWLQLILLCLQGVNSLLTLLQSRQLLDAGEAKAISDALLVANGRVEAALAARRHARDSEPNPDDPYNRD